MVFTDYLENLGYDNYWMAVLISIFAIIVVFGILALIIAVCSLIFKIINKVDAKITGITDALFNLIGILESFLPDKAADDGRLEYWIGIFL